MVDTKKSSNPLDTPESFTLSEIGYSGQKLIQGLSVQETKRELNFPHNVQTFKEMSYHPSINAALSMYNTMVAKANYRFVEPENATAKEKKQTEFVREVFNDMDRPLSDVIQDIMSMNTFGFSVIEKVYKKRKGNNSQYPDGRIGIKKLGLRNQESIDKFVFDDTGNDIIGVKQDISKIEDPFSRFVNRAKTDVVLPRSKVMLFTTGRATDNPYGVSPLRDVYLPWKYLTSIEELEAAGVAKDLQGLPVLYVPAQYMSPDASTEQKALYEQFKNIVRNLQNNSQSGVVLPSAVDPETRQPLFKLELLSTQGGKKNYDTDKVKEYYRAMIFIGMNADILLMGNTQTGSFALGSIKTSMTGAYVEGMLKKIVQVFNDDLIRQLYELNGWDVSRRARMDYEGFSEIDLEAFSKAVQRMGAVAMLPRTPDVVNMVLKQLGVDVLPGDTTQDEILALFPDSADVQSRAGDGMTEGMPSGTGSAVGSAGDSSSMNADNSA